MVRLCKSDAGRYDEPDFANEAMWTSFAKVRLLCSANAGVNTMTGASVTVEYNFLQDVQFDSETQLFSGVFLNKDSAWAFRSLDSAVCTFSVDDIRVAFDGHFVYSDSDSHWQASQTSPVAVSCAYLLSFKSTVHFKNRHSSKTRRTK